MEFGYTRKDILILTFGLLVLGYALYYGAQAFGVEAIQAGNYVQMFIFLVICVGYTSTYIFRVANKVSYILLTKYIAILYGPEVCQESVLLIFLHSS